MCPPQISWQEKEVEWNLLLLQSSIRQALCPIVNQEGTHLRNQRNCSLKRKKVQMPPSKRRKILGKSQTYQQQTSAKVNLIKRSKPPPQTRKASTPTVYQMDRKRSQSSWYHTLGKGVSQSLAKLNPIHR